MTTLLETLRKLSIDRPKLLEHINQVGLKEGSKTTSIGNSKEIEELFPHLFGSPVLELTNQREVTHKALKIGVVFSGGQASGGHNVIAGLFDALKAFDSKSELVGFQNGPDGIINNHHVTLTEQLVSDYRNTGGFDMIGSGRTKIETKEQLAKSLETVKQHKLEGLIIIGGDDSNTNAAVLAEYFLQNKTNTKVIGVPKTIDGDLKNEYVELSFGFDTACRVYSEMIGNIAKDALSAKKYTHFIKLMGRSASHIALECALKTHPNLTLISEEIEKENQSLESLLDHMTDLVMERSKQGKNYGLILIPEGVIEFVPEIKDLITTINQILSDGSVDKSTLISKLSKAQQKSFDLLPVSVQDQLLLDRDPHGNVQVSHIQTEKIFIEGVDKRLKEKNFQGKFSPVQHFFGYEGRASFPSLFDATYCYSLGLLAALLIQHGKTGYMVAMKNLKESVENWQLFAVPITSLMNIEVRKGKEKPVIKKALVDLESKGFQSLKANRKAWELDDDYCFPGPIQFFGDKAISDTRPLSL